MFPCGKNGNRRSSISKIPALEWKVPPCNESAYGRNTNVKDGRRKVSGADSEKRTNLRETFGSLNGT